MLPSFEFERAYLSRVRMELEDMGFTDVTRLEHNHTCDFKAKLLGVDSMIEVRGRSKGATKIIMKLSKFERMKCLGEKFLVFLYVFNEEGRKAIISFPGNLPQPFQLSILKPAPKVKAEPFRLRLDCSKLEFFEQWWLRGRLVRSWLIRD